MRILSFDTTNNLASVAIRVNGEILAYDITKEDSQQAEKLFSLIEICLKEAKLKLSDIDLISVTNGPGSFTGVRIGLAAAAGMQSSFSSPIIALTNFQILAWYAKKKYKTQSIAVVLNARREQIYFQAFDQNLNPLDDASLINITDLNIPSEMIVVGDGACLLPDSKIYEKFYQDKVDAKLLAEATEFYWSKKSFQALLPLYIREPYVSEKKKEE